jgi:TRAF3-interacting protein 1
MLLDAWRQIVAGLEPEATNTFLQMLGRAARMGSAADAVQQVLAAGAQGGSQQPVLAQSSSGHRHSYKEAVAPPAEAVQPPADAVGLERPQSRRLSRDASLSQRSQQAAAAAAPQGAASSSTAQPHSAAQPSNPKQQQQPELQQQQPQHARQQLAPAELKLPRQASSGFSRVMSAKKGPPGTLASPSSR